MQYNVIYYCIKFMFFYFHKLMLSTNVVLYLQKQSLAATLQKQLLLTLRNLFAVL